MESGGIVVLENRSREKNFRTDGGTGGAGIDFEGAAELGHAFAHAGDANTKAWLTAMRSAVVGNAHPAAEVCDFEDDAFGVFVKPDLSAFAAGVSLNVGEAFLSDAKEGGFCDLRETAEAGEKLE